MDKRTFYCTFYIFLLTMSVPALCIKSRNDDHAHRIHRRFAVAPIAAYAGMAVSPWVWAALVAAYGLSAVLRYRISRTHSDPDSHSCANNRGWCRPRCFSHERIDWYHSDICGNYYCCRTTI